MAFVLGQWPGGRERRVSLGCNVEAELAAPAVVEEGESGATLESLAWAGLKQRHRQGGQLDCKGAALRSGGEV